MNCGLKVLLRCCLAAALFAPGYVAASQQFFKSGKSSSIVNIEGAAYYVHTVKKGETLYSLSKLYGVTERDIVVNNPQVAGGLRDDHVIKIPVKAQKPLSERRQARIFDTHTVIQGETAYSISRLYGISVSTLIEDNKDFDPAALPIGQQLNIRKSDRGTQGDAQLSEQWNEYAEALGSVTPDGIYHMVAPGETLYGLSKHYGVGQQEIAEANDNAPLRAGALIKIPGGRAEQPGSPAAVADTTLNEQEYGGRKPSSIFDGLFPSRRQSAEPRRFEGGRPVEVALMLPLRNTMGTGRNFLDFYQGALIGLEDLKRQGISVKLNLYDTERSEDKVRQIVESYPFTQSDIILGPVYEEDLRPVLKFAAEKEVAVVSPLATIENASDPLLYQLAPDPALKYDKLRHILSPDRNVVAVRGGNSDEEMEREIAPLLPPGAKTLNYYKGMSASQLEDIVRGGGETVLVVFMQQEYAIDDFLTRISSVRNNMISRSIPVRQVTVVGSSRWQRFTVTDKNLFFKLNLCFVTSYHADRSNDLVMDFNKRYIAAFGSLPSLYSYRGYDTAKLFVGTLATQGQALTFNSALNLSTQQLMQMKYRFRQDAGSGNHVNTEWALVCYSGDYTIEVK